MMERLLRTIALLAFLPVPLDAQASPFSQLRGGTLRGLRELTLYVNIDAPGSDEERIRSSVRDSVTAMLRAEGLKVNAGGRTAMIAIYPGLFVEMLVMEGTADSVLVSGSITLIELTQSMRTRTYLPSMTWAVRNRPRLPREGFHLIEAEALSGVFIHDWRCASGRLGECTTGRVP